MFYNEPIDLTAEEWIQLLKDKEVTKESDFKVLKMIYESEHHEMRAAEIAARLQLPHHSVINSQMVRFSKRVVAKTGIQPPLRRNGTVRWWHVPFLGYEKRGKFPWIMRPELVMAFDTIFESNPDSKLVFMGEISTEEKPVYSEGAVYPVYVDRYERSRKARNACIQHYGSQCVICGFDFEKVYGPIGKNKIHVHHLTPLSEIQGEYEVDPIRDLRPVCPNCHLIIHSKKVPFTIEEVKNMLRKACKMD